ncbi:predicted protein [Verticillium alfalfae VaMs.102]|uniref:Predicted protein n=1 Tax=Verticillium alfalfae (strain VaMs.102 / ATCC MYA-4576 / FGSC 10136) TaxID=526221 RepID=C9SNR1_VERA1|nr:predicted protein [Verticillium alfalfae VaMs.102]EEY20426.1 predicted protein [Verticillium alfalfae VaMs.102]
MEGYGFTLTGGAIFGIVISVIIVLVAVCVIGWHLRQRNHRLKQAKEANRANDTELAVRSTDTRRQLREVPAPAAPTPAQQAFQSPSTYGDFAQQQEIHGGPSVEQQSAHDRYFYLRDPYAQPSSPLRQQHWANCGERQLTHHAAPRRHHDRQEPQEASQTHHSPRNIQQQHRRHDATLVRRPHDAQHQQERVESKGETGKPVHASRKPRRAGRLADLVRYDPPTVALPVGATKPQEDKQTEVVQPGKRRLNR